MNIKKIRTICVAVAVLMLGAMALGAIASVFHHESSVVLPDNKQNISSDPSISGDTSATIHTVRLWAVVVGLPIAGGGILPVVSLEEKMRIAKLQKR